MRWKVAGFSLLEFIVVLAVLIGAAGVVLPLMAAEMHDTKLSRALDDVSRIGGAFGKAMRECGLRPGADTAGMPVASYYTNGSLPAGLPTGKRDRMVQVLGQPPKGPAAERWKGPYLGEVGADPWGRAYVLLVPSDAAGGHVWCLSAGRDGVLQTSEDDETVQGDDVGVCVR
jgi:type II secretory pathway pseudopilin PulG